MVARAVLHDVLSLGQHGQGSRGDLHPGGDRQRADHGLARLAAERDLKQVAVAAGDVRGQVQRARPAGAGRSRHVRPLSTDRANEAPLASSSTSEASRSSASVSNGPTFGTIM